MSLMIKTTLEVSDPDDFDSIAIHLTGSVTGLNIENILTFPSFTKGRYVAIVEGSIEHLDGFEDVAEFKKFLE